MSGWNIADSKPQHHGAYRTLSDGQEGYSLFDLTDRIWGCTQPTIELALQEPEFFYADQEKCWRPVDESDRTQSILIGGPGSSESEKGNHGVENP